MGSKFETWWLELFAIFFAKFWVLDCTGMTVRVAEMFARNCGMVELIWWDIISKVISSVISEPKITSFGVPIKTYSISDSSCENFKLCTICIHSADGGIGITLVAYVAGSADRDIQLAVGAKCNEFPPMHSIFWKVIFHDNIFWIIYIFFRCHQTLKFC